MKSKTPPQHYHTSPKNILPNCTQKKSTCVKPTYYPYTHPPTTALAADISKVREPLFPPPSSSISAFSRSARMHLACATLSLSFSFDPTHPHARGRVCAHLGGLPSCEQPPTSMPPRRTRVPFLSPERERRGGGGAAHGYRARASNTQRGEPGGLFNPPFIRECQRK